VEASPSQLSADLPGRAITTNANASGPNFESLSVDWQDKHCRCNSNRESKGAHIQLPDRVILTGNGGQVEWFRRIATIPDAELDRLIAELGKHPLAEGQLREVKEAVFVSLSQSQPEGIEYAFCLSSGGRMYFFFRKAG
jgi:hypothetical protein